MKLAGRKGLFIVEKKEEKFYVLLQTFAFHSYRKALF
jgi:hypothetical protein